MNLLRVSTTHEQNIGWLDFKASGTSVTLVYNELINACLVKVCQI
jgi:hypothetical protein